MSAYDEIRAERARQDALAGAGRWAGESIATISNDRRLRVLVEEVGEVARDLEEDEEDDLELRIELVQVAAVAVAWLEALDAV